MWGTTTAFGRLPRPGFMYGSSCNPKEIASLPHIKLLYLICYVFSKSIHFPILVWPKEDVPNLVSYLNRIFIFEWYVVRCGSKNGHQNDVSKRHCTMCSRNDNHSRLNRQHNWRDVYGHLMSTRIFTLIIKKIFKWAPKVMRKVATALIWICWPSHTNRVFRILIGVG